MQISFSFFIEYANSTCHINSDTVSSLHLWNFNKFYIKIFSKKFFTFSSRTEYVKRESIVIAWVKKKILSFWWMFMFCTYVERQKEQKKNFRLSVCMSVCLSVCLDVCTYVRALFMWTKCPNIFFVVHLKTLLTMYEKNYNYK